MTKNDNRNSIFMTGFLAERDTNLVIKYLPSISIDNRWKGDNKYVLKIGGIFCNYECNPIEIFMYMVFQ